MLQTILWIYGIIWVIMFIGSALDIYSEEDQVTYFDCIGIIFGSALIATLTPFVVIYFVLRRLWRLK